MALAIANRKNMNSALSVNQITPGIQVKGANGTGDSHPPRNMMGVVAKMVQTPRYSKKKNIWKGGEPYSTMNPATNSDSASTRSNGGRFVSASAEMKKTKNTGNGGNQYQLNKPYFPSCAATIAERFNDPAQSSTVMMTKPIETSYDTICAAERSA